MAASGQRGARVAACPSTVGPPLSSEHWGTYPMATRRASNSSAVGLWSQTATAVSSPNQVTANVSQRASGSGTSRS